MGEKHSAQKGEKEQRPSQKREEASSKAESLEQVAGIEGLPTLSGLPDHSTARTLRQQSVLRMQERYGNQYVQRALEQLESSTTSVAPTGVIQRTLREQLEEAMEGWGTDEEAIFTAIANASDTEKQELLTDSTIISRLADELSQEDMGRVLSGLNAPLAMRLNAAMDGWGTDEETIMTVTANASPEEKRALASDTALMRRIESELSREEALRVYSNLDVLAVEDFANSTDTGNEYRSRMLLFEDGLVVTKDVNYIEQGTFGEGGFERLKSRIQSAITSYLSGKFSIRIESPDGTQREGDGTYPISVVVRDNPGADYPMNLHGGTHGRSGVNENEGNIYELGQETETIIPDITLAHEAAHFILGASDEYANARVEGRVVHTDHSLLGNFYAEGINQAEVKARHFQFLVELVQRGFPDRTVSIVPQA